MKFLNRNQPALEISVLLNLFYPLLPAQNTRCQMPENIKDVSALSLVILANLEGKSEKTYSLVHLVWQNREELISRPFIGLLKIRLMLQDCVTSRQLTFYGQYRNFHFLCNIATTGRCSLILTVGFVFLLDLYFSPSRF